MRFPSFCLFLLTLSCFACRPSEPEISPLPTKICIRTQHHQQAIPNATVYVKYNADSFPGYDKPPSYYDASFETGAHDHGCLAPVPEGRHWLVAFGYDSLYFPHHVYGSLRVDVSLQTRPVVDTILYISE